MAGLLKKRDDDRREAEIPIASMADIAFLLLIFFLVTSTIDIDTGIGMTLPPPLEEEQEPPPVEDRNMLSILVNAQGQVLIEDEESSFGQIREELVRHVTNYGEDPDYSDSPDDAVISLKTDSDTPYTIYIDALDEMWMGYREIWEQVAQTGQTPDGQTVMSETFADYEEYRNSLGQNEKGPIREYIPANISIAEPDVGEE